jgi:hypothetical protein
MKRLVALALGVAALALLGSTGVVHAQELPSRLPNANDPTDRKAVIAVVRAAKASGVDLQGLRFVVASNCGWGGANVGQGLFIADQGYLGLPH